MVVNASRGLSAPRAVIFDLGGTLVDWPGWVEDAPRIWGVAYDHLALTLPGIEWPEREAFVAAMREAEMEHWRRVETERWSGPPSGLLAEGFRRLGRHASEAELLSTLDAYGHAVDGWAIVFPDSQDTLRLLRERGYRLGLLSNTWWAADWHNADLATHGLDQYLDELVYTSDLPHSKPHPSVFEEVAGRLGVEHSACVMIGDRMVDDVSGALAAGMRGIWRENANPWPKPEHITPTATVSRLADLPDLLRGWGGA